MSFNHYISDFVARVNNSVMVKSPTVKLKKSKLIINICKKLVRLGYFDSYSEAENEILATINYDKITKLKVISKPGQRYYVQYNNFPKVVGGIGFNIVSTSQGIMTNHESKQNKIGGELLFQIY